MRTGPGWYLFRCPKCKGAFIATMMAEWCDCGNAMWAPDGRKNGIKWVPYNPKQGIWEEMNLEKAEGCLVVWDHRRVGLSWRGMIREWLKIGTL